MPRRRLARRRGRQQFSKSLMLRLHAGRRLSERYGVTLTNHVHDYLVRQIHHGQAVKVAARSTNLGTWKVTLPDGRPCLVVYDRKRQQLVTALPPA